MWGYGNLDTEIKQEKFKWIFNSTVPLTLTCSRVNYIVQGSTIYICIYPAFISHYPVLSSLVAQTVNRLPAMWETQVQSLG